MIKKIVLALILIQCPVFSIFNSVPNTTYAQDTLSKQEILNLLGSSLDKYDVNDSSNLKLIAPSEAPQGSPVQILAEGAPEECLQIWRRSPVYPSDTWLELYDRNGNAVNIFWSLDSGPRVFELIVAENGESIPVVSIATHHMKYGPTPDPGPVPLPFPEPSAPTLGMQDVVGGVLVFAEDIEAQDLLNLTEFYVDFADIVRRDNANIIETTEVLRSTYMEAGQLMFQRTGMQGKYDDLPEVIDATISDYLGLEIIPLDSDKAADVLHAIAWAFYQPLKKGK